MFTVAGQDSSEWLTEKTTWLKSGVRKESPRPFPQPAPHHPPLIACNYICLLDGFVEKEKMTLTIKSNRDNFDYRKWSQLAVSRKNPIEIAATSFVTLKNEVAERIFTMLEDSGEVPEEEGNDFRIFEKDSAFWREKSQIGNRFIYQCEVEVSLEKK